MVISILKNRRIICIFAIICIILSSSMMLNLLIGLTAYLIKSEFLEFIVLLLSINICFLIIPTYLSSIFSYKFDPYSMYKFSNILIYTIIFILVFYFFDDFKLTLFYLTIAMGEEYLFREVVYKILLNNFSFINSIIIGSLLFSLLLHLNESIITNLLIRFPSSILLYLLRYAFGLRASISIHWIYNILVSKVIG